MQGVLQRCQDLEDTQSDLNGITQSLVFEEVPMRRAVLYILSTTFAIFLISACAGPSRLDKDYGKSTKQALSSQVLHPEAEENLEPVTGLDGKAAQASIEKYRKTFEQPREAPEPLVQTGTQANTR